MLITCPSCAAEYNLPNTVPPGRMVKCARCQTKWAPVPAPPPPPPEPLAPPPGPEFPATPTVPADGRPTWLRRRTRGKLDALGLAWLASGVLLLALLAAALVWRQPAMQAWPPSQRLYAWLGLR